MKYGVYGIYSGIRNAAWRCLIDYQISALPVNVKAITKSAGIRVLKNSKVGELIGDESGVCIFDAEQDVWNIIYDDECTIGRRRFIIAHELGHIFLGHEILDRSSGQSVRRPKSETEADMFASRLLAPACVLWALDLHTAEEIDKVCDMSMAAARARAERMKILYDRQKFLTSKQERTVFEQFQKYIDSMK